MLGPKIIAAFIILVCIILGIDNIKERIWEHEEDKIRGYINGLYGIKIVHCSEEERKRLIEKHDRIHKRQRERYLKWHKNKK